jgi:hypothetical protein
MIPSRRFSSSGESSLLCHLSSERPPPSRLLEELKAIPSEPRLRIPSENLHVLCSPFDFRPLSQCRISSGLCALTRAALFCSDLLLRLDLGLHPPARLELINPNLDEVRTKVHLLSLLDALYAEEFNCTRCRNLLA